MSGICGQILLEPRAFDDTVLEAAARRMLHRGRVARRVQWKNAWFGALDDSEPKIWPQPGHESSGLPCAVLDGRVDNAADLAEDLAREGHQAGGSQARLIAEGLRAHGPAFLARLQGPFAAAAYDPGTDTAWLARDAVGMRPLYLHRTRSRILFASEIRAILADPIVRLDLDSVQLRVLLSLGFNPAPHTLLKGIHKLPPGHYLEVRHGQIKVLRFDPPPSPTEMDISLEDAAQSYRGAMQRIVRRSASPRTAVLLSGGADSSSLVVMRRKDGLDTITLTAGFGSSDTEEDERALAWQAARHLGSLHRERAIDTAEIPGLFGAVARTWEEPTAAVWSPMFARLIEGAAGQADVVWSGQGVGPLHGEGPHWRWLQWGEWVAGLPNILGRMAGTLGWTLQRMGSQGGMSRALSAGEVRERILTSSFLFSDEDLDRLLRTGHLGDREQVRKLLDRWREPVQELDPLAQGLYISARTYLPDSVLGPAERLAAGAGVSLRFPYADPEVVRWLEKLPAGYRVEGKRGKRLHREALSELVPADVLARPKRDLGDPVRRWLQGDGKEKVTEWLLGSSSWLPSVLDGVRVRNLIEEGGRGQAGAEPLCLLVHLELWAREVLLGGGGR